MVFKASVGVTNPGLLEAYAELLEAAPEVVNRLVNRTVNRNRDRLLSRFRKEPGRVVHPIRFTTLLQQRALFASRGFGAGLPTTRSHALVNAWKLPVVYSGTGITSIVLENDNPARPFVIGRRQQLFHKITGWYQEQPLILQTQRMVEDEVETDLIKSFYAIDEAR